MNPLSVETALRTALAASAFPETTIYTGTDYQELTPESLNVIVSCAQLDHTAGALYKAQVTIRIIAPALLGAASRSEMASALGSVRAAMTSDYLSENWPTESGTPGFGGIWIVGTKTSQQENEWVAEVDVLIGVSE